MIRKTGNYRYTNNDPVNATDPTGFDSQPLWDRETCQLYRSVSWWDAGRWAWHGCDRFYPRRGEESRENIQGGGGVSQNLLPEYSDAEENFDDFLVANPDCSSAIDKAVGSEGAYRKAFDSIQWLEARGLSDDELKKERLSKYGETGQTRNQSLYNVFANPKGQLNDAIAIWTGQKPTVIVHFQGIQPKDRVVAHETLHILFKGDHASIAEKLGLGGFEGKDAEGNASKAIDNYLKNNCGQERK